MSPKPFLHLDADVFRRRYNLGVTKTKTNKKDRPSNFTTCLRMEQQLYHNAHNLLVDACILYKHRSFPTAFAIAVLAYEELGKLHLLDHINAESWGLPEQRKHQLDTFFSGKQGFNHTVKQRWALAETQRKRFSDMYHDGHLDQLKQACFYVGFRKGRIITPDRIKARTAFNQIRRVLKLARNTKDMPFLNFGPDGKWESTADDRAVVRRYMRKAEAAVSSLRGPTRRRRLSMSPQATAR
jgi:AbiV family abortive infection protein